MSLLEKLKTKDKFNDLLQTEKNQIEENLSAKLSEVQKKLQEKSNSFKELQEKMDLLLKENKKNSVKKIIKN